MINGLDLFSGLGGLSLALKRWVRPIAYCESDRYCQSVLLSRMQSGELVRAPIWDDVRNLKGELLPAVDIVYGGFPCQDVSDAGIRIGVGGERTGLVTFLLKLCEEIEPSLIFLENVPGIRRRGADGVIKELARLGYDTRWTIVSAEEFGAPHRRNRWFLLAAHAYRFRLRERREWHSKRDTEASTLLRFVSPFPTVANTHGKRGREGQRWKKIWGRVPLAFQSSNKRWPKEIPEPAVCAMPDGIPSRVDSLKALGNAVVPLQAEEAFRRLMGMK